MSFFKNVWADLVERKLWPVAIGLLVALVALPVALGRGGGEASVESSAAPVAPDASTPAAQAVSLSTAKPKGASLGRPHNPFRGIGGALVAATGQSPSVSPAPPPAAVVGGTPSDGGGSGEAPTAPSTPPPSDGDITSPAPPSNPGGTDPGSPVAPATIAAGYRVDVTYGRSGSTKSMDDLARLSPLSALQAPIVLYLGVKDDQSTAIFMVLSDVAASGDGTCRPTASDCQVVGLREGDAELFDVPNSDGQALRYELQVDNIASKLVSTERASVDARHRESSAGRDLLHDAIAANGDLYVVKYRYALGKGVVTKVMPAAR